MSKESPSNKESPSHHPIEKFFAFLGFLLSVVYLLNPTAGFIELIPDNIPIIGNLDEAGAVTLLIFCLAKLGVRIPGFGVRSPFAQEAEKKQRTKSSKDVIDV